jgi:hypothetical protein
MKHRRTVAITGLVVAVSWGALATATIGSADGPANLAAAGRRTYLEPSVQRPPDGAYLGYVRALGRQESAVAVDFVSLSDGVVDNTRPEQRVDAGALGEVGFFDPVAHPFRIRIQHGVIVAVQRADDMVESAHVRSPRGWAS